MYCFMGLRIHIVSGQGIKDLICGQTFRVFTMLL